MKRILFGLILFVALGALGIIVVSWAIVFISERERCRPFIELSNDPTQREKLRGVLTTFLNDKVNLAKIELHPNMNRRMLWPQTFGKYVPWTDFIEGYNPDVDRVFLLLRFDPEVREFELPNRITEAGLYYGRSIILYENLNYGLAPGENETVSLSEQPYVICPASFDNNLDPVGDRHPPL